MTNRDVQLCGTAWLHPEIPFCTQTGRLLLKRTDNKYTKEKQGGEGKRLLFLILHIISSNAALKSLTVKKEINRLILESELCIVLHCLHSHCLSVLRKGGEGAI